MSAAMPGVGRWTNTEKRLLREALAAGQSLYHASAVVGRSESTCERMAHELGLWARAINREPGGQFHALTNTEARLVVFLARHAPAVIPCGDFAPIFGYDYPEGLSTLLRAHVSNARKKGVAIENRRGFGYWMTVAQAEMALAALPDIDATPRPPKNYSPHTFPILASGKDYHTDAFMRGQIRRRLAS